MVSQNVFRHTARTTDQTIESDQAQALNQSHSAIAEHIEQRIITRDVDTSPHNLAPTSTPLPRQSHSKTRYLIPPSPKLIFVNRYFYPDTSATSQLLSDLAFALAKDGKNVHIVTSKQLYENPNADLPSQETWEGITIHRVTTSTFGRHHLAGRALDYGSFYTAATRTLWNLTHRGDLIIAETDPPLISCMAACVAKA